MIKIENLSRFIEESPYGSTDWDKCDAIKTNEYYPDEED